MRWMRGAQFGEVVKVTRQHTRLGVRAALLAKRPHDREIAHVKLDANGKVIRVVLAGCVVV